MTSSSTIILRAAAILCILPTGLATGKASGNNLPGASSQPPGLNAVASTSPQTAEDAPPPEKTGGWRSEEHTSELQSHLNIVCRLLLEKKKRPTLHSST